MKRIAAIFVLLFAAGLLAARAQQNADDQYLNLYGTIQQADELADAGSLRPALLKYNEVQVQLQQFQRVFPDWNPKVVTFRLNYIADKITSLTAQLPAPASIATNAVPVILDAAAADLTALRGRLDSLQMENTMLLAKLKEALSAQPAMADAGELAKAQAQIQSLMKENDLLKTSAATNPVANASVTNSLVLAQTALAAANQKLAALTISLTNAEQMKALDLKRIAALQTAVESKQLEEMALENRIQQLQTNAPTQDPNAAARIEQLTQERDDLLAKLGAANKRLYGTKKQDVAAQMDQLTDQVRTLRERLAVAEAPSVPYTPEELVLLKQAPPQPAPGVPQKKSVKELPPGSAGLVAEAQSFFTAGQFDRAEADYLKVLEQDPNNALVLGNLAAIEMQQGKLDAAEKHVKTAIAQDPDDAFNVATFGYLKFREEKYDEALDLLSRAAKLDPQNPEIQNYLGVTLANKGLRAEAETALRKAIQLNPDYAVAHKNLAAIYISQTPPMVELARWHYQKALAAGLPHSPDLEKALDAAGTPPAAP